jgi:hypothetical protein
MAIGTECNPIALIADIAYATAFARRHADTTLWRAAVSVIPSAILALPLPDALFT